MKNKKSLFHNIQPILISLAVFATLVIATYTFTSYKKGQWEKDIRAELLDFMTNKKSNLEKALYSRIYYTRGVAAYVALNPNISNNEFAELAKEYIKNDTVISTMALSKGCILNAIYPLKNHEAAIGLDLLAHPERKEIVEKTIQTHLTFVAGPVELVEGGTAFISYTPIFNKTTNEENKFWGVTDIVIKQNSLFSEAKLTVSESGYNFALRGYNGTGSEGSCFWGKETIFDKDPVIVNIELPIGNWSMAAVPANGWNQYPDQDRALFIILFVSTFFISILIGLFSKAWLRIRYNEKEQKAVFDSLDSLIMEFNIDGDYLKINSINENLLFLPKEELTGKNLDDIFDKKEADFFKKAIRDCINNKKLVIIEYPMVISGEEHWFSARLSYKYGDTAIFNSYDITKKKKQEKLLIDSEKQLKELNKMKDKFFSIIAHDLRGPLGSQKALIDLLLTEYEDLDEATRKDMINNLQDSSNSVYILLENLLKWSLSQSGKIDVCNQAFDLHKHITSLLSNFTREAQLKNIQLENKLDENTFVLADINLTETILQNLVSNAIKFTQPNGTVKVSSKKTTIDGKTQHTITVSDTGIGINPKKLETLFRLDKTQSTPGTANETGNGLGLILSQEFAEKQGTVIHVTSTSEKGSTFSFMLPTA